MNLINTIDTAIYNLTIKLMNTGTTAFMMFVSHLGSAVVLITLAIAFVLLLKNKKDGICIALNLVLVFLLNRILKFIIARPRPEMLRLVPEDGYSFPSRARYGFNGILRIFNIFNLYKSKKQKGKISSNNIFKFININHRNKSNLFRSTLLYRRNRWVYNSDNLFKIIYKTCI